VPRGVWQYTQADHIAGQYDDFFACNRLFEFDEQVLARHLAKPGLVVDLGCGTGRAILPLARRGFPCLGVDLSHPMLRLLGQKAEDEALSVWRLCANLADLGCLQHESADYCLCLFSTLGMIRGSENRQRVLVHAQRILKPGGLLIVHVHNFWFSLFDAVGRRWLLRSLLTTPFQRDLERGDKFFDYRGIPKMFLHTFSHRELRRALVSAEFYPVEWIPLDTTRQRPLRRAWLFGSFRANGWIVVCRKPAPVS
jgi:SAM-dependent methyltransferase